MTAGAHGENRMILIRDLEEIPEIDGVAALEKEVWGVEDRDVAPLTMLIAAKAVGALLIGAFDEASLVGFAYGFPGFENKEPVHHSHMLAVKPEYRNFDLGYKLKLAQRERVLAQGIRRITWTFDPLQSRNAHFNFAKLGALADAYKINFYGEETSSFLHKVGTDRLWVSWLLDSQHVRSRLQSEPESGGEPPRAEGARPLVRVGPGGAPERDERLEGLRDEHALIEIPADINALQAESFELAARWREATRWAFTEAIAAGYVVEDFRRPSREGRRSGMYRLSSGKTLDDF
jgi:predicted GNAT superfamily acetyltransferase